MNRQSFMMSCREKLRGKCLIQGFSEWLVNSSREGSYMRGEVPRGQPQIVKIEMAREVT